MKTSRKSESKLASEQAMDRFESVLSQWLLTGEEDLMDQIMDLHSPEWTLHQLPRTLCEGMGSTEAICNSNSALLDAFKALLKDVGVILFDILISNHLSYIYLVVLMLHKQSIEKFVFQSNHLPLEYSW